MLNFIKITGASIALAMLFSGCTSSNVGPGEERTAGTRSTASNSATAARQSSGSDLQIVSSLPAPANTRDGADLLISKGDVLEIDVFQVDELDKTVQVDSSGRVSMPLVGQVAAEGKTVAAFEQELETKYGIDYLQSPDITVLVKESAGQRVTLDGEFVQPGIYPTGANTTLLQTVALARGLSPIADDQKIYVYRDISGRKLVANYNLKDIRGGQLRDPRIYGGDVIVAFPSGTKVAQQNLKEALGLAVSAARVASPL